MNRSEILSTLLDYKNELILKHNARIEILDRILEQEREKVQPLGIPYRKYMRNWHESKWEHK